MEKVDLISNNNKIITETNYNRSKYIEEEIKNI